MSRGQSLPAAATCSIDCVALMDRHCRPAATVKRGFRPQIFLVKNCSSCTSTLRQLSTVFCTEVYMRSCKAAFPSFKICGLHVKLANKLHHAQQAVNANAKWLTMPTPLFATAAATPISPSGCMRLSSAMGAEMIGKASFRPTTWVSDQTQKQVASTTLVTPLQYTTMSLAALPSLSMPG